MVYRLVAAGTIEEKVMALKARKGELAASVLDAGAEGEGERGVGALDSAADGAITAADLRELLDG
jgi:SNF2 family DNA or RNA helicase